MVKSREILECQNDILYIDCLLRLSMSTHAIVNLFPFTKQQHRLTACAASAYLQAHLYDNIDVFVNRKI